MRNRHLYWLSASLTSVGLAFFLYKIFALDFPLTPGTTADLWEVEVQLRFVTRNEPVRVMLFIPTNTRPFAVVDENFVSRGYGLTTTREQGNRQAVWSQRNPRGEQALYYRAVVRRADVKQPQAFAKRPDILTPNLRGPRLAAAQALLAEAREQSADIDTLVAQLVKRLNSPKTDTNAALLLGRKPDATKPIKAAVEVLALGEIPARLVRGILVESQRRHALLTPWLQVYDGQWKSYDPTSGELGIPHDYLLLWRGNDAFVKLKGGSGLKTLVSVRRSEQASITAALMRGEVDIPHLVGFSLFGLPIATQEVYRILLLIPVGALVLVLMRNVVGVKTFGTFMPILIALAFRETELLWGVVLFSLVVALGLSVRFYLEHLKLLIVPRLASVLIVVVLLMVVISVITHKLGLERGLSVALFPMVILTMTIERMSIVWEERGAAEAIQQGLGSLAVAVLAYLVMSISYIAYLVFVFPELMLLLLASTLLLGRYAGYRLLELRRFKVLASEAA
ncbi:MAG: inactive transglutaminase family protein [Gammaproteobacteria bacterium]|nr:inactive transglutaminase family protein [Gammaproteobacteria bacterium]